MDRGKMEAKAKNLENSQIDIKTNEMSNNKKTSSGNPAVLTLLKRLSDETPYRQAVDRETGAHFLAWFQDGVRVIRKTVENPTLWDSRLLAEIEFFLGQIEHHFIGSSAPQRIWDVFRYLRYYFKTSVSVRKKHVKKAIEMVARLEQAASKDILVAGGDVRAWYNNRVWVVLRAIESPKFKETERMMEIEFFLEALENYFIGQAASRHFKNAFRYLKCYFVIYPFVRPRQSEKAVEMIGRIYQAMNYEFSYQAHIKPGPVNVERNERKHVKTSVHELIELLAPIAA